MPMKLFSIAGCTRCKTAKQYMDEIGLDYEEHDAMGSGADTFRAFYKENRPRIFRGPEGVEFPILSEGENIYQGLAMVMARLMYGEKLTGFFRPGLLHGEWVDGIDISGGDEEQAKNFLEVLANLKGRNFKLEVHSNGRNADLLEQVLARGLAQRVVMEVKGPLRLYADITGQELAPEEMGKSLSLTPRFPEYLFYTVVAPIRRGKEDPPQYDYLTPEEIGEIAALIKEATGDKTHPYLLKPFDPKRARDKNLRGMEAMTPSRLFKYRTAARRHLVKTEIQKSFDLSCEF